MRINLSTGIPPTVDPGRSAKPGASSAGGINQAELATDTAKLSTDGSRIAGLTAAVNELPEIRQERVAALSEQVRSGTYRVSPEQTAEAIISHMLGRPAA